MHPKLKAVVFDWAGTMIDFGSRAPVLALQKLFEDYGVPIGAAEAQADMGRAKRDHIGCILRQPRVVAAWQNKHGTAPDEADGDALFLAIGDAMRAAARTCAVLIPGAADVAQQLKQAGIRIGSCTGYSRDMMVDILPMAAQQGYVPDIVVCADDTLEGRPSPLMAWKNLVELGTWPASACVKVDDTQVGIAEGLAAGMWTIGVAASGNGVGLSHSEFTALEPEARTRLVANSRQALHAAGAHVVIDSVADLQTALAQLNIG